jgi:hypothetical protein
MNDQPDRRTKLLAELFHEDWATGPLSDLARIGAAHARRRRRIRRSLAITGSTAALAIAGTLAYFRLAPVKPGAAAKPSPAYEIISDDELLALLRDRPLLVIPQPDGTRRFVVLEK